MKKLVFLCLFTPFISVYAVNNPSNSSNMEANGQMNKPTMMYFDFGLGVGSASNWTSSSLAIQAMNMGIMGNKYVAAEVGMGMLPSGETSTGNAMIMTYHIAAKGLLPLSDVFALYGKAGVGVNSNMAMNDNSSGLGLYYAGGMQFNFNRNFGVFLEGSGVAIPSGLDNIGNHAGNVGSTYMGTFGLHVSI